MKHYLDKIALANCKGGNRKIRVYALQHKESRLFFHKMVHRVWNIEDNYYTAPWPMVRRSKGAFSYFLEQFEKPEEWEVIEIEYDDNLEGLKQ